MFFQNKYVNSIRHFFLASLLTIMRQLRRYMNLYNNPSIAFEFFTIFFLLQLNRLYLLLDYRFTYLYIMYASYIYIDEKY